MDSLLEALTFRQKGGVTLALLYKILPKPLLQYCIIKA
jgi:hypothetical protein